MGWLYHCEYCEKSFKNDTVSIKKHLNSLVHQRAYQEHYAQFKEMAVIVQEESTKQPCGKLRQFGECQFGALCRYSHYSPAQLQYMRQQVEEDRRKKAEPSISDWLQTRSTLQQGSSVPVGALAVSSEESVDKVVWSPPPSISIHPNLPPSLQPVTIRAFANFEPHSWG